MAGYAAVISLKHTINGLLNSSRISLMPSTRESLEVAYNKTTSLQQVLERLNDSRRSRSKHERVDGLEGQIRDFAHTLEDVLEFHEYHLYSEEEEVMRQEITLFGEAAKKMEKDYIDELSRHDDDDDDDDAAVVSRIDDFGVEMVGHSSELDTMKRILLRPMRPDDLALFSFWGPHGNGRSVPVRTIFEDDREGRTQFFDCWAWVTVGAKHQVKEVVMSIISQVRDPDYEPVISIEAEEEKLSKYLYKLLENRRYMIVLDDVDHVELVNYLRSKSFPDQSNGSVVFLTTALKEVAQMADQKYDCEVPPSYFEEVMWFTIREVFFGLETPPEEMEVAGKKIIQNCGCQFITACKTFMFLLKSDKTVEEWSKIAADKQNPTFMISDELSEINQIRIEMLQYHERNFVGPMSAAIYNFTSAIPEKVKMKMHPERLFSKMQIISFYGMAGIGKTMFATNLFKDESVWSRFDRHVWINLGPKYQTEEILIDILAQIYPNIHKLHMKGDEKLVKDLCTQLSSKRCLVVLDDLYSKEPLHHLKNLFPDIKGTTLVTTRLVKVAKFGRDDFDYEMDLLDKEESWCLLCKKVFAGGTCPPELEKVGRKIAEKCDGLPLLILTVADQLLKVEISQEYWNAHHQIKSVFRNAHHQISEALLPSYQSLPQHLKPCFLYTATFSEKYEIPISNLTHLWISEGLLESNSSVVEEDFAAECLSELLDRSMVIVQHKVLGLQIKTCRLHAVFWHLSNTQAGKNKLFHAMNCYDDCSIESIESQRRLCIRNSILLGMKDVQKSVASNTSAHSLLCVGPLQQYPVPLNFELRLLRVVNAITIRLYEFPVEVVELTHLKYLSLMCNGELPTSISNLWKLQYLIVKRYMNINSSQKSSHLPVEIWDMKELKHLQVTGGCLPNRKCGSTGLLKLSTLLDVSAETCRKKVLKGIPNLKRLGIRIELVPGDEGNPFRCLNRISRLRRLESLKCVVVNPQIRSEVVSPPAPLSMFPPNLKELSLSGLGYPWEYMSIIGKLKNLQVLKLKCYAFEGSKWEMEYNYFQFEKLKFLLVEDTNLVHWKVKSRIVMGLEHLCIKHCYKLQEFPASLRTDLLKEIEIVDCNPLTVTWAKQTAKVWGCEISVHDSWRANNRQE